MADDEVLIVLVASTGRRLLGVCAVGGLGMILLWLAAVQAPGLGWQAFMLGVGGLSLWMAIRMWHATARRLELTPTGLQDDTGRMIARMEDIRAVDRGVFAFKPSNGFMLRLSRRAPGAWQPGLWWRAGRLVGVGGVTASTPAKIMAELIEARIGASDQDTSG